LKALSKLVLVCALALQLGMITHPAEAGSHSSVVVRQVRPICRIGERSTFCAAPARRIVGRTALAAGRAVRGVARGAVIGTARVGRRILFGPRF
jgi:hypothetical protein